MWFWTQSSLLVEGRATVRAGLDRLTPETDPATAARGWFTVALLAVWLTDPAGAEAAEKGIECATRSGNTRLEGMLRVMRGIIDGLRLVSDADAERWLRPGLELIENSDDPPIWETEWDALVFDFFVLFSGVDTDEGYVERSQRLLERSERLGDAYMGANARLVPAGEITDDNRERVLAGMGRAVEDLRRLGFRHGLGHALFYHGVAVQDADGDATSQLGEASTILAEVGDVSCSIWSGMRQVGQLLDTGRLEEAGNALRTAAGRLASFDGTVDSDLVAHACRWALGVGDVDGAARLLGHAEANGQGDGLEACRAEVAGRLDATDYQRLLAEGSTTALHEIVDRIGAVGV